MRKAWLAGPILDQSALAPRTRLANNIFVIIIPGPRVVARSQNVKKIGNVSLVNFGSSHAEYPYSYLALACAIGMQKSEIIHLIPKLSQG